MPFQHTQPFGYAYRARFGDVAGGNYAEFEAGTGFLVFYGNGRAWLDYNFGVGALARGASAPDLVSINSMTAQALAFDGVNTPEQVSFALEMNHNWAEATTVYGHVHWMPTTAAAGNVEWFMEWSVEADGSIIGATPVTSSILSAAPGVAWQLVHATFPQFNIPRNIEAQFVGRLYRDPTAGNPDDTYGADACITTVGLHVLVDTLGSRQIGSK